MEVRGIVRKCVRHQSDSRRNYGLGCHSGIVKECYLIRPTFRSGMAKKKPADPDAPKKLASYTVKLDDAQLDKLNAWCEGRGWEKRDRLRKSEASDIGKRHRGLCIDDARTGDYR